jgi:hypothetical protein
MGILKEIQKGNDGWMTMMDDPFSPNPITFMGLNVRILRWRGVLHGGSLGRGIKCVIRR